MKGDGKPLPLSSVGRTTPTVPSDWQTLRVPDEVDGRLSANVTVTDDVVEVTPLNHAAPPPVPQPDGAGRVGAGFGLP